MNDRTIPTSHYNAFIIDADNTLFDFNKSEREALRQALRANGYSSVPEDTCERYHDINDELWKRFEQGGVSQDELRIERFRRLLSSLPPAQGRQYSPDPEQIGKRYIEVLSNKGYLLPHARVVLQRMSARVPLLLLSNGIASVQRRRIAQSGIGPYFRDILISAEVELAKPDPAIFALAIERLGCDKRQILCVGDSPSSDIRGGRSAGLDTCWFASGTAAYPAHEPPPTYRINDLRQLLDFLPSGH